MSRFDKCSICDYNEQEGSTYSNTSPGERGHVRKYPQIDGEQYCEFCAHAIYEIYLVTSFENVDDTEDFEKSSTLS